MSTQFANAARRIAVGAELASVVLVAALLVACGTATTAPNPAAAAAAEVTPAAPAMPEAPEVALRAHERAIRAMTEGDWAEAEIVLATLTRDYPELAGPHVNLALVHNSAGREDLARAELDLALAIEPLHPAANNQLGIMLRRQGDFAGAEEAYRRAIEGDPAYALAHYNLGVLLDVYRRRPAEGLHEYEQYQALLGEPDQKVGRWIADLRRRLGAEADGRVALDAGRLAQETNE